MRLLSAVTVMVAIVLPAAPSLAETYVVNPEGNGDFPTIQAAIDAAGTGDIVELTDGTFTGEGNRDISFKGKAVIVGSQSGNPEACIIDCQRTLGTPHRGFDFHNGEGAGSVLEGVKVAKGWTFAGGYGAGVRCRDSSSPTLINCAFTDCAGEYGGGVSCENSNPMILDCIFEGNWGSQDGGGLYCSMASPIVEGCVFLANGGETGSGMYCNSGSAPTLTSCVFSENSCTWGGGICCEGTAIPILINCTFSSNSAPDGGAILVRDDSSPMLTNCTFSRNIGESAGSVIRCRENGSIGLFSSVIAFSSEGMAVECVDAGSAELSCCNVFGNAGGDWVGCIAGQLGSDGNIFVDPLFCGLSDGNFTLCANSPCAIENNTECGQIGAWPVGCETCQTAVRETTWGEIKIASR